MSNIATIKMKLNVLFSGLVLTTMLAACGQAPVDPETPYVIEGELTGVSDSIVVRLFQYDGNVGTMVASDTLIDGHFRFEQVMAESLNRMGISVMEDGFPSMSRTIYVAPGAQIKVKGHNSHIYTWDVESKVPEQQEYEKMMQDTKADYDIYQELAIEDNRLYQEYARLRRSGDESEETQARIQEIRNQRKALTEQEDSISNIAQSKQLAAMKKLKPSQPWLEQLASLASMCMAYPDYKFRNDAIELYNSLPEDIKSSLQGQEIYAGLYPPEEAQDGADFPDATFYDLQGNEHHIAEHKGKYILLDFWSSGCGPCILAFPEMKQVYEKYQDRLAIVSMSTDTDSRWRKASEEHDITWSNWNEGKGTGGLYAHYRIRGIPYYVLINPEGKIEQRMMGYGENMFTELFAELLGE